VRFKLDKILCAADFSAHFRQVMHYGVGLALQFEARLLILHSVCFPHNPLYGTAVYNRSDEHKKLGRKAGETVEKLMKGYSANWEPVITFGEPVEEIVRVADEQDVDMVIAASHGLSGLKRMLFGTVVERLVREMTRPVLVVRLPAHHEQSASAENKLCFGKIVTGCDVSAKAIPMLGYAMEVAAEFGAELHLLHAIERPVDKELMDSDQAPYGEVQQAMQDRLRQKLLQLAAEASDAPCDLKAAVLQGVPGERLSSYAAENASDLIIIGKHQHTAIEKLLVGSTAEAVLRSDPCPVMVLSEK